ncbi:hypothetical protein ACFWMG_04780 [Streptomyces sp. NPDC127074]|uniref:hypothetical protein n=1 Tax=Streptomyces sp. NPDC127074 TaxID=3347130 RepID=UPI00364F0FD5
MATYKPGVYAFRIAVTDPAGKVDPFVLQSNVTVDRVMTDQEIAQFIVTASRADYPAARVLRLPNPNYGIVLERKRGN